MLALFLITTVLLFGGLSEAIDSENGTWLLGHPIRSGLPKWSRGRDIQGNILLHFIYFHILTNSLLLGEKRLITFFYSAERSNGDFADMITKFILPHRNCNVKTLIKEFGMTGDSNYACWCGAGTVNAKMFKPQDILDCVCRGHDICYDKVHDDDCPEPYDKDYLWNGDNGKVDMKTLY